MKNFILNEGYDKNSILFESGKGDKVYYKKKKITDLSHCSGSLLFGHNNNILVKSLREYLNKKVSIFSHPNLYAVKFSKSIKLFFPNFKKIIYCNSGTEAITKAIRISFATNNKNLIVSVAGSWHGSVGKTLFYPDKNLNPHPISAGLEKNDQKKIIFIPYNDVAKSKVILDKYKKKINCLIIEPILAGLPMENVSEYLVFLKNYCKKNNINLIFDEVITGFRTLEGSVQKKFKITPDITILGKVLGGGLPIGLIGITNKILKKISFKKKRVFFGGTFSGNSMSAFVGHKTLNYLSSNKKILHNLVRKCHYFQNNLNNFFLLNNVDAKVYRFQSILRIVFSNKKISSRLQRDFLEKRKINKIFKLKKYLLSKGIYYPNNGIIFFSSATSYKSINTLLKYIKIKFIKDFKN